MSALSLPSLDSVNYTFTVLSILIILGGWWATGRGKRRTERDRVVAERERQDQIAGVILGTPAVTDATGAVLVDEQPGLGARTKTLEEAFSVFVNQDARIVSLETSSAEHGSAIAVLLADKWERGAKDALKTVEKQQAGVIDGEVAP